MNHSNKLTKTETKYLRFLAKKHILLPTKFKKERISPTGDGPERGPVPADPPPADLQEPLCEPWPFSRCTPRRSPNRAPATVGA